jgi:hypothetical protein
VEEAAPWPFTVGRTRLRCVPVAAFARSLLLAQRTIASAELANRPSLTSLMSRLYGRPSAESFGAHLRCAGLLSPLGLRPTVGGGGQPTCLCA